jgi:hypothetical protein
VVEYRELCTLSRSEGTLLDLATDIAFGELHDVDIKPGEDTQRQITEQQFRFLRIIRELGVLNLNKVTIQNGVPVFLEVFGEKNGIRFIQKFKI